ncbi:MAG: BLUF domain-containing protein, partial [Alphaproteobacteria bacterium]
GVTGLLLFYEGVFLQALEGPAAGVMSLAERLRKDRRHSGMITLESQPIDERAFPDAMQFVAARNLSAGEKQAFSDLRHAVSVRPHMIGAPAPGADNGLWELISAFNPLRAV